jgi:hypothetical protein
MVPSPNRRSDLPRYSLVGVCALSRIRLTVREPMTTPRSVFSLRTSAFNDFLYAPVGEENNGMVLTMLSTLARCGVDPWGEAARLSELPRQAAAKRLVSIISGLPRGQWAQSDVRDIATRLADLLPVEQAPASRAPSLERAKAPKSVMTFFFVVLLANALVFTFLHNHEPSSRSGQGEVAEVSPQAPISK